MLSKTQLFGMMLLTFVVVFVGCLVFSMVYHGILPFLLKSVVELKVWHILIVFILYKLVNFTIGLILYIIKRIIEK